MAGRGEVEGACKLGLRGTGLGVAPMVRVGGGAGRPGAYVSYTSCLHTHCVCSMR